MAFVPAQDQDHKMLPHYKLKYITSGESQKLYVSRSSKGWRGCMRPPWIPENDIVRPTGGIKRPSKTLVKRL